MGAILLIFVYQKSVAAACQVPHARISEDIVKDALEIIKDTSHKLELY